MRRRWFAVLLFVLAVSRLGVVLAHEGDVHKIMGTVAAIHENHLEVKTTNGKTSSIVLNDKTKILKGKAPMKPGDIKVGTRVVVAAMEVKGKDGKPSLVAKQVNLGAMTAATKK